MKFLALAVAATFSTSSALGQGSPKPESPAQQAPEANLSGPAEAKPDVAQGTEAGPQSSPSSATPALTVAGMSPIILGVLAAVVGYSRGGIGGGSSSGVRSYDYSDSAVGAYLTEYNAQSGLGRINARSLNDYNYTGYGIRLAIVDTGIAASHQEFSGRTVNGTDFASTNGGSTADVHGHGTHVASIAAGNRDAVGMRGVAYDATLYSYKIGNDAGSLVGINTDAKWAAVVDRHVTDSIKISNNSWGSSSAITSFTQAQVLASHPLTIAAYQNAVANGTIFVWAAGNNSRTQPSVQAGLPHLITGLADRWLAVVSVNSSNAETDYTNRCGVAADWFLTAPGGGDNSAVDGIYAAQSGGTYVRLSGTSMAAPHVSGLLAAIAEKFPELTSAQLVSRVKTTASLAGLTAVNGCTSSTCSDSTMRAIFGHGLVNGAAAVARIGTYIYPKDGNVFSGNSFDLAKQQLSLPAGLTESARLQLLNQQFKVFDSFDGATFKVTGRELFNQQRPVAQIFGYAPSTRVMESQGAAPKFGIVASEQVGNGIRMTLSQSDRSLGSSGADFWGQKLSLIPAVLDRNGTLWNTFEYSVPLSSSVRLVPFFVTEKVFNAPNLGFAAVWKPTSRTGLMTSYGSSAHQEARAALPGYGSAGLNRSISIKAGIRHQFSETLEAFGHISRRTLSDAESTADKWGYRGATYTGAVAGLEFTSASSNIALGVVQPEQISSGKVSLVVPDGRLTDGTVLWREQSFSGAGKPRYAGFLAARYALDKRQKSELLFQMQQSTVDTSRLERATISFITSF